MIIAGFDIATTTGAAVLDGSKVLYAEAYRVKGDDDAELAAAWTLWFEQLILSHGVQHVAMEQPLRTPQIDRNGELSPKSNMSTYLRLYGLRMVAMAVCGRHHIPCRELNQMTWRAAFVGNGRATKEQSFRLAKQLYPKLKSLDAAEAIGIAWALNGELSVRDLFEGRAA